MMVEDARPVVGQVPLRQCPSGRYLFLYEQLASGTTHEGRAFRVVLATGSGEMRVVLDAGAGRPMEIYGVTLRDLVDAVMSLPAAATPDASPLTPHDGGQ